MRRRRKGLSCRGWTWGHSSKLLLREANFSNSKLESGAKNPVPPVVAAVGPKLQDEILRFDAEGKPGATETAVNGCVETGPQFQGFATDGAPHADNRSLSKFGQGLLENVPVDLCLFRHVPKQFTDGPPLWAAQEPE